MSPIGDGQEDNRQPTHSAYIEERPSVEKSYDDFLDLRPRRGCLRVGMSLDLLYSSRTWHTIMVLPFSESREPSLSTHIKHTPSLHLRTPVFPLIPSVVIGFYRCYTIGHTRILHCNCGESVSAPQRRDEETWTYLETLTQPVVSYFFHYETLKTSIQYFYGGC